MAESKFVILVPDNPSPINAKVYLPLANRLGVPLKFSPPKVMLYTVSKAVTAPTPVATLTPSL